MEKWNCKSIRMYMAAAALINVTALVGAAVTLHIINGYMPFGGFASLFFLLILTPYLLATAAIVILLLLMRRKKPGPFLIACILQALAPIPWLAVSGALGAKGAWFELAMILQIAAGISGLLLWASKKGRA